MVVVAVAYSLVALAIDIDSEEGHGDSLGDSL